MPIHIAITRRVRPGCEAENRGRLGDGLLRIRLVDDGQGRQRGYLATEENFLRFLRARANVAPATPSTSMPNFPENSLNDRQAKDIYAYIRTFKSTSPDVKNIPALTAIIEASKQP
jgi:hypothetical protein